MPKARTIVEEYNANSKYDMADENIATNENKLISTRSIFDVFLNFSHTIDIHICSSVAECT